MALAELVGRQSAWSFHLAYCGNAWMATFTEKGTPKPDIATIPLASFVSASGRSRALAIARALLKVVRMPALDAARRFVPRSGDVVHEASA
jgi:hypothetical protein